MAAEFIAFSAEHVSRLTGLSPARLRYWDKTGFFSAEVRDRERRFYGQIYSFRDIVGLRTIAILRNKHRVPLQQLRKIGEWLRDKYETPWASLRLFVSGDKKVHFRDAESGRIVSTDPRGQIILDLCLKEVASDMKTAVEALRSREKNQLGKIERHRHIVHNSHVVAGTRIPTAAIWNLRSGGYRYKQIADEYPSLTDADIKAALKFEEEQRRKKAS